MSWRKSAKHKWDSFPNGLNTQVNDCWQSPLFAQGILSTSERRPENRSPSCLLSGWIIHCSAFCPAALLLHHALSGLRVRNFRCFLTFVKCHSWDSFFTVKSRSYFNQEVFRNFELRRAFGLPFSVAKATVATARNWSHPLVIFWVMSLLFQI